MFRIRVMNRRNQWVRFAVALSLVIAFLAPIHAQKVELQVDTDAVIGHVDENIYGQFLEHIYHSVNGGIWGEIVFNRSFEERLGPNGWFVHGSTVVSPPDTEPESHFSIGPESWKDYDATIVFRRTSASGTVGIGLRVTGKNGLFVSLGLDGNRQFALTQHRAYLFSDRRDELPLQSVQGSIDMNRWYTLRVRCEARHATVWIDGKQLFEWKDVDRPNGQITLDVSGARAEFRIPTVTGLDRQPLLNSRVSPTRHWDLVGTPEADLDENNPLNSSVSLRLVTDAAGEGVEQGHLAVRRGDALRGNFWLRGAALKGVVVRLVHGDTILASQRIYGLASNWKSFPLTLLPSETTGEATLQILSNGKAEFWVDQISLIPDSFRANGGFRTDLLKAMQDLHPAVVRWPGGSFVGGYDWKKTIGPEYKRVGKRGWDEWDPLAFGIDEYMRLMERLGAQPLIVIYMGPQNIQDRSRYIQDAWDFVEYCNGPVTTIWGKRRAENGHPAPYRVKYWEIDNEVWSENPDNYVQAIRDFSVAMKAVDPSISLIACGSGDFGHRWGQGDIAIIDQVADMVDFLSIHRYESPDHFDTGPERAELFWGQLAERIAQSKNPRLRLFVSEWNAQSTDWRTGLYAGGELNAFESNPIVGMASPALWLRHVTAPSWDNAFINFDQSGWFPAPNYVVMKLYREHYAPQLLRITGAPDALSAVATRTADGHTIVLKLVNTSAKPMEIRLKLSGSLHPRKVEMFTVAPDSLTARNTMEQLDAVRTIESTLPAPDAGNDEKIAISRWSVNVVVLTTP